MGTKPDQPSPRAARVLKAIRAFARSARLHTENDDGERIQLSLQAASKIAASLEAGRRLEARLSECRKEIESQRSALEQAEGRCAALETIMRNEKIDVPGDPPDQERGQRSWLHRAPGSFEGGRRR